ncbi:MAG: hypothetical protein N4A71_10945 [Carboxylicivirga sp.]|jgi:hypothetical protein|nr:hypothetical protein [Carboxylicivirga sp.]
MAYLLDQLEELVANISNPEVCLIKQGSMPSSTFKMELDQWHRNIKDKLLEISAGQASARRLNILIGVYQSSIIRLIDELSNKMCPCQAKDQCHSKQMEPLIQSLIATLKFIHIQFSDYFDSNSKLPQVCEANHRDILKLKMSDLFNQFSQHSINAELLLVVLHPFTDFINQKKKAYSFNDKYYLYNWLENLEEHWQLIEEHQNTNRTLCKLLVMYNLNSNKSIEFITSYLTERYKQEDSKQSQILKLKYFLKNVKQISTAVDKAYLPLKPSLKKYLIKWLTQEIKYIENSCHISEYSQAIHQNTKAPLKIKSNLSVSKLALFLRLSVESGVFAPENKRDLLRHFANNFSSAKTDTNSFDSLHNKFYSPDQRSLEVIKKLVLKQLNFIQENKF